MLYGVFAIHASGKDAVFAGMLAACERADERRIGLGASVTGGRRSAARSVSRGWRSRASTSCGHTVLFAPGDARRASACDPGAGRPRRLSSTQRHIHLSPAATEDAIRLLDGRGCGVGLAGGEPWRHFGYAGGGEVKRWGPSSR